MLRKFCAQFFDEKALLFGEYDNTSVDLLAGLFGFGKELVDVNRSVFIFTFIHSYHSEKIIP